MQCTILTFLDNRPVKDIDRACIQAWAQVNLVYRHYKIVVISFNKCVKCCYLVFMLLF